MGNGLSYTLTPTAVAGLQPQVPPHRARLGFPIPPCGFQMSPKVEARTPAHRWRPQLGFAPAPPLEAAPSNPAAWALSAPGLPLRTAAGPGNAEPARPPARPPHAPRARAPRPLPQVTCTRPPLCDPARWPGLSRARPAVARGCGPAPALQAPPRPRLRRPTGSQRRGERESWDAPPAEVGKLPRGGGGARRSLGFAPSAWAARPAPSA